MPLEDEEVSKELEKSYKKLGVKLLTGSSVANVEDTGKIVKVTVKNTGTGVAKGVTVTATGGGKGKGGNINPGASKTITVKTKVSGRKGGKATIKFTAKAGNVKATGKTKVSVK